MFNKDETVRGSFFVAVHSALFFDLGIEEPFLVFPGLLVVPET
jgi:hypothetical protein